MIIPPMTELLEAGVHFGHQVRKWHPQMSQFIYGAKDGVHIIDLEKTVDSLRQACKFLAQLASNGGLILFVGTKRQAAEIIKIEADRCGALWITERWIGGLLTNFEEIHKNIDKLKELETKRESGQFEEFTKKERLLIDREIAKLNRLYYGLKNLDKVPDAIFVVDVKKEEIACREAKRRQIPVVAICDTNADLSLVDYPIPGNDDAVKSIKILTKTIADAIIDGQKKISQIKELREEKENKGKAKKTKVSTKKP